MPNFLRFARRVLSDFFLHNHGLLLTAAVAQNMTLSPIPLLAVLLVLFSAFFDPALLLETIATEVALITPGFTPTLSEVLTGFLESRELVGWIGGISLFFFSSMAFRVIRDAIAIIFHRPVPTLKRRFWVSVMVPYLFVLIVVVGLIAITAVNIIYGSMATIIVLLITMEAIALILLLGAQVIADLQRSANAGIPWHEEPPEAPAKNIIESP